MRKLHVSARTAVVFTRITILDDVLLGYIQRDIATSYTINVIPIDSTPYLPHIRNKEYNSTYIKEWSNVFVPYYLFYKLMSR